MNNRKRAMCWFAAQAVAEIRSPEIYATEQVTTSYRWLCERFGTSVVGSEYLGPAIRGGDVVDGVRHEDIASLSFGDAGFDLVISLDVLAHVTDPTRAIHEMRRVLKPGGQLLLTVPFNPDKEQNVTRHRVSTDGSPVFTDFGWELAKQLGTRFERVEVELFESWQYGHVGPSPCFFRCRP